MTSTMRRVAMVGAMAIPLAFAATGLANAGDKGGHCGGGHSAVQGGGLLDLGLDVSPATNIGGILNSGPVVQQNSQVDQSNSGIIQSGGGCGGGFDAFQAGDLVKGALSLSPATNIGGIGSSGPVHQTNIQVDNSNSGIVQDRGGWGGGAHRAVQGGDLIGLHADVSPATNIGGILSGGPVAQGNSQVAGGNSGIVQR